MDNTNLTINFPGKQIKTEILTAQNVEELITIFKPGDTSNNKRKLFITDATIASLDYMQPLISKFDTTTCGNDCLLVLGSGEPYKTLESVMSITQMAWEQGFTRNDIFVGIGGGVICELAGFAASIYERGVEIQLIPTTLLSMVDSAIGGKTSCNYQNIPNHIGTFYPATKIYYVSQFLSTLPDNQFKSGLAEAIKTSIIADSELYDIFKTKSDKILQKDTETITEIIFKTIFTKIRIVEQDFFENNIRYNLYLGHTFANALEVVAGLNSITHGEAVAWGISRAINLSWKKGYCLESLKNEVLSILETYGYEIESVPSCVTGGGFPERLLTVMKKNRNIKENSIIMIIPKSINDISIEAIEESDILSVLK